MSSVINADTTNGIVITSDTSGEIKLQSAGADIATVNSSGVSATTFIPTSSTVPTNGVYLPTTNTVGLATNNAERMRIDSSGNVGIDTTSPSEKLNVVGNILASGVLKSTSTSMANSVSNATTITVNTATPTAIASCSITTTGKPVLIVTTGDGNPNQSGGWHRLRIHRDETAIGKRIIHENAGGSSVNSPFALCTIDTPSAGTYTYSIRAWHGSGSWTYGEEGDVQAPTIFAVEIL